MKNFRNLITALLLSPAVVFSQSPKKYFEAAEKFELGKNYKDAVDNYSKAIDMDPKYEKAYLGRASAYEKQNRKVEAIEDYKSSGL